jgi:hypothetical protein
MVPEVDHQPTSVKKTNAKSQGVVLPLLGVWRWGLSGGRKSSPSALGTGNESLALAPGTDLARSYNNPGFVARLASAFACETCYLTFSAATRTLRLVFAHRHPSFYPESPVNRDSPYPLGCL